MQIKFMRSIEQAIREIEVIGTLLMQMSKDLRELQERIQKLEEAKPYGNRQRSATRSD